MFFRPIIQRWPTAAELAADLGILPRRVQKWARDDSIPGPWFAPIARAAARRGFADINEAAMAARAEARELATPKAKRGPKGRAEGLACGGL